MASEVLLLLMVMLAALGALGGGLVFGADGAVMGALVGAAFALSAAALF